MNVNLGFICEHKANSYDYIKVYMCIGDKSNDELMEDAQEGRGANINYDFSESADDKWLADWKEREVRHFQIFSYNLYRALFDDPVCDVCNMEDDARIMVVII